MRNIEFRDTDKKFKEKIYGIEFEINTNKLDEIDVKQINDDINMVELLDSILGENACEKLNKVRKENGYNEVDTGVGLAIFSAIMSDYIDYVSQPINTVVKKYNNTINNYKNMNNRVNKNYNRNYRRY